MNKIIKTSHQINASADIIWGLVKKGDNLDKWLPVIASCQLVGEGEGAKRICKTEEGDMLETILKVDEEQKIFQYSIDKQSLLPIDNIIGTMQIVQKNEGTKLHWNLEFTLTDESLLPMIQHAIDGLYTAGAHGLQILSKS